MAPNIELNAREVQLLIAVGPYIKLDTNSVDWAVVAEKLGCKTTKVARNQWYPIRDKLFGGEGEGGATPGATPAASPATKPKKTPASRKRKAVDEDDTEEATPSKGSKKTKAKKADTPIAEDYDEKHTVNGKVKAEPTEGEDGDYL